MSDLPGGDGNEHVYMEDLANPFKEMREFLNISCTTSRFSSN
jgi:hypothetical protein